MEKLNTLEDLFESELKDIYDAEHQVLEAIPRMVEHASSPELKQKFEHHRKQIETQIARLEEVFEDLDMEAERETCMGMQGILKDGEKIMKMEGESHVKDAALIAAVQHVEHYEIASYGTLAEFARTIGWEDVAEKLKATLKEDHKTDQALTELATSSVNKEAPV